METFSARIKKSGKELGEQSNRLLSDTREAGKHFVSFVQDEAKEWGGFIRERYQDIEQNGRKLLRPELPKDGIWVHIDSLVARIARRADTEHTETTAAPEPDAAVSAERSVNDASEIVVEDAVGESTESTVSV